MLFSELGRYSRRILSPRGRDLYIILAAKSTGKM
jgi:hypothetical protein